MNFTGTSDSTAATRRTSSRSTSMAGSSTRKRSGTSRGHLTVCVVIVLFALQCCSPVWSASLSKSKRSADQSEEVCRNNGICGWEVYHPSTRNLQYYVASSCKCFSKEICIRAEDDISISAYVFRCRDSRKKRTTRRPTTEANEAP